MRWAAARVLGLLVSLGVWGCPGPSGCTPPPHAPAPAVAPAPGPSLRDFYDRARAEEVWSPPSAAELEGLRGLGRAVTAAVVAGGDGGDALRNQARDLGLDWGPLEGGAMMGLVGRRPRGWGAYTFRRGPLAREVVLQAPHTFHDQLTGELALDLFREGDFRALFFNTTHRYTAGREEPSPSDPAHNDNHPFQAITAGLEIVVSVRVLQIHGFGQEPGREGVDVILSAGDGAGSGPFVAELAQVLRPFLPTRTFPEEVDQLGGTTNVQGLLVRGWPGAQFVHVELSAEARRRLLADAELRARLISRLLGHTGGP